jgi:exodeoxyribonuclease VII small subunit
MIWERAVADDITKMSFEDAMKALEEVVSQLERGDVALEQSLVLYDRGAALKAHCATKLKEAEEKVEQIRLSEGRAVGKTAVEGL